MNRVRLPLALSVLGHAALLAGFAWLTARPLPLPQLVQPHAVAVVFAAPTPPPAAAPAPPPPATAPAPPPSSRPPPPSVAAVRPLPPPPPKPVAERHPLHIVRRHEEPRPPPPQVVQQPQLPLPPQPARPQIAALPPPRPAPAPPTISAAWRAELGAWLQSHKTYPESARERGEEGEAQLRFRVDRSGRVLDYAVVRSTGYPDLDAAITAMMRGASLPAFPGTMPQPQIQVSVAIRFALR